MPTIIKLRLKRSTQGLPAGTLGRGFLDYPGSVFAPEGAARVYVLPPSALEPAPAPRPQGRHRLEVGLLLSLAPLVGCDGDAVADALLVLTIALATLTLCLSWRWLRESAAPRRVYPGMPRPRP